MSEYTFDTPGPIRVELTVASGALHIAAADDAESTVALRGAPKLVDTMHVAFVADRLVIEQRRKSFMSFLERFDPSLEVNARVPAGSQVEIVTASADAVLDGAFSGLEVKSASGTVSVTGELSGDATVKTVSGDVRLQRVAGNVNVRTVSADVTAGSVGGSVSIKSVSGDVQVGSLRQGQATVQSVSGDVALGVAAGTNIDLDAGSASGALTSDVPLAGGPSSQPGPTLVIRSNTVSGDFRLFRAAEPVTAGERH